MRNFLAMIVSYVVAIAIVLSYVFVALGSIVGIIICVETLFEMYGELMAKYRKHKKRAPGFGAVESEQAEANKRTFA